MSIPSCPVHNVPMKLGNGGTYFCTRKMPDGSWCKSKAANPDKPAAAPGAVPTGGGASPKLLLAIAALDFAGRVYAGSCNADEALALANQTISAGWEL